MSTVSGFPTNNSSLGIEQSGKGGGDAFGNSASMSGAAGGAAPVRLLRTPDPATRGCARGLRCAW